MTTNEIILIIALTLWGECRGEPLEGQTAVASVIYRRGNGNPERMADACLRPRQFSCWNPGGVTLADRTRIQEPQLALARQMAEGLFTPVINADHYHAASINPYWTADMEKVAEIGNHIFYSSKRRW